jgi:tetratricopeptide (TPR) repeat protein
MIGRMVLCLALLSGAGAASAQEPACKLYKVNTSLLSISKDAGSDIPIGSLEEGDIACVTRQQKVKDDVWGYIPHRLEKPPNVRAPVNGWATLRNMKALSPAEAAAFGIAEAPSPPAHVTDAKGCKEESGDIAINGCTELIRHNPRDRNAYFYRGIAYGRKGEFDRAIADFTKAIEIDPELATAFSNRGLAYGKKGEYDRAIADLTKAIAIDPKLARAYSDRGIAYYKKGDRKRAIADYRKALQIEPGHQMARENLERLGAKP